MKENFSYSVIDVVFVIFLVITWIFNIYKSFSQGAIFKETFWMVAAFDVIILIWFYYRNYKIRFLFTLLTIVVMTFLFSFSLEHIENSSNINSQIYVNDQAIKGYYKNLTFYYIESHILFDTDRTILVEKSSFDTYKLENKQDFIFTFSKPDNAYYNILLTGNYIDRKNGELIGVNETIINSSNYTALINDTSIFFGNKTLHNSGQYNLILEYYFPKMEPNGNIEISLEDYSGQRTVPSMYTEIGFSDMIYECMTPCIINRGNTSITGNVKAPYQFNIEKPFSYFGIIGNNISETSLLIRTTNKYPITLRILLLGIIGGLTVGIVQNFLRSKEKNSKYKSLSSENNMKR